MNKKAILAIANVLYILVVTKSYKKVMFIKKDVLPSGVYFVIDKKVTMSFSLSNDMFVEDICWNEPPNIKTTCSREVSSGIL